MQLSGRPLGREDLYPYASKSAQAAHHSALLADLAKFVVTPQHSSAASVAATPMASPENSPIASGQPLTHGNSDLKFPPPIAPAEAEQASGASLDFFCALSGNIMRMPVITAHGCARPGLNPN
jgi:hypothetical protein